MLRDDWDSACNRIAELEADLAKCESQKRGLAAAARKGLIASNNVIGLRADLAASIEYGRVERIHKEQYEAALAEQQAELERRECCGSCHFCRWQQGHPTECFAGKLPMFVTMGRRGCLCEPSLYKPRKGGE